MAWVRKLGTVIFGVGMIVLAYGAIAFWLVNSLPPNGGPAGRLPSLYVMGVGIVALLLGLAIRGLRISGKQQESAEGSSQGIPAVWGIMILVLILVLAFVAVARM